MTSIDAVDAQTGPGTDQGVACAIARSADDMLAHRSIRRAVFVVEQGLFDTTDLDDRDSDARTIHVLARWQAVPAGSVRLYPIDDAGDVWQGDRLAVLPDYRTSGVGAPLVRFAVETAGKRGGSTMVAHIQVANVAFFRRLGWVVAGEVEEYVGQPHVPMKIALR